MERRSRPEEQAAILTDVLARAAAATPRGIVVFDLDSTLLDNRPRQARILQDYGREAGVPALLAARPDHWDGWSLEAALASAGLSPSEVAAHAGPARRFWLARFFTSAYCRFDVQLPGAPEYGRAVAARGAPIAYVTGRPAAMEPGTVEVLRRFRFPLPGGARVRLLMKRDEALGDDAWKALARDALDALGPVVAAFDNEPAHVNAYARAWPAARCVHLDTDHSPRAVAVLDAVPSIRDFRLAPAAAAWGRGASAPGP